MPGENHSMVIKFFMKFHDFFFILKKLTNFKTFHERFHEISLNSVSTVANLHLIIEQSWWWRWWSEVEGVLREVSDGATKSRLVVFQTRLIKTEHVRQTGRTLVENYQVSTIKALKFKVTLNLFSLNQIKHIVDRLSIIKLLYKQTNKQINKKTKRKTLLTERL
jgi:hypothetical protein